MLFIIIDGKLNDFDFYDLCYGIEDIWMVVYEVWCMGLILFCVIIDCEVGIYLFYLFGLVGFCVICKLEELLCCLLLFYV